jgi:hypothetical protein
VRVFWGGLPPALQGEGDSKVAQGLVPC